MINCNPETVSTDYDTSDRLYFEPLTLDGRARRDRARAARGRDRPVRRPDPAQAGARAWPTAGVPLLGTPVESIHLAEDRPSFGALLDELGLRGPPYATAESPDRGARGGRRGRATRCWCALATCSAAGPWRSVTRRDGLADYLERTDGHGGQRRSSSTASWRTRSRSTWTPSATARAFRSARSCSTSRRPACTRATRPA